MVPDWTRAVLDFWFDEVGKDRWFNGDRGIDASIRERFLPVFETASIRLPADALTRSDAALAAVVLLDQFPRNMFRATPRAFATDLQARAVAANAVDQGLDRDLTQDQRCFLYLPFEHSESLYDQDRSVELFEALGNAEYTRYARAHRDVIARFGRFPHRNAILARQSTPDEVKYLAEPGSGF